MSELSEEWRKAVHKAEGALTMAGSYLGNPAMGEDVRAAVFGACVDAAAALIVLSTREDASPPPPQPGVRVTEEVPVEWMRDRLPANAIPLSEQIPPKDQMVVGWIGDATVCIHNRPAIIWWSDEGRWWSGVPGNFIDLSALNWNVTHWLPLAALASIPDSGEAKP